MHGGPDIGQREAGGEVPRAGAGVPDLHGGGQREGNLGFHTERGPTADGHLPVAAHGAVQVDLAEVDHPDRLGRHHASVGLHAGARHRAAQRPFRGLRGQREQARAARHRAVQKRLPDH
ncbi:hypothetical protein D3C81_1612230 [compost metagenome]